MSFKFSNYTPKANNAVNLAVLQAASLGHTYIGSEHLLLGILKEGGGISCSVLRQRGISEEILKNKLIEAVGRGIKSSLTPSDFTPRCKHILEAATAQAKLVAQVNVGTEHILMAILKEPGCYAVRFLQSMGIEPDVIYREVIDSQGGDITAELFIKALHKPPIKNAKGQPTKTPNLDKFSKDLTQAAREGNLDPLIGRNKEILRVIQILTRRTKNNPCLIGEAGVGKTAIAEGLAQKMLRGEVPESLKGKRVVSVELSGMIAGTKFRGEFEERLRNCLNEVNEAGNIILFIDELHTLVGAGSAEGAIDAANILKPQLARGELQVIGATTTGEYRKHIENDSALARRFQSVMISEPTAEETIAILNGLKCKYEEHHHINITDEAINAAVQFSVQYLTEKFLPDKAIDLLDEASSLVNLKSFTVPKKAVQNETQLKLLVQQKEMAVIAQNYELAAKLRDNEVKLRKTLLPNKDLKLAQCEQVRMSDVAEVVAFQTGIDVSRVTEEQSDRLLQLEKRLHCRVIGQNEAVSSISRAIRRNRVGLGDPNRPIGSFLFLGPTGVGKTELSKALAEALFADEKALIRVDMSEFMEKHTVSRLIGSPPGYIGYDDGGQLTEKVRRKPYSVLLFDEIEKAHCDVFNIMLQILDDGILTDAQGKSVNFKNCVIIMTSNVGAQLITEKSLLGFSQNNAVPNDDEVKVKVLGELKKVFRPEFLNRIDDTIVFHRLTKKETELITVNLLECVKMRAKKRGIKLHFTNDLLHLLAEKGFDSKYGARPLRRVIQNVLEDTLAEEILNGNIAQGDELFCDYNNKVIFSKKACGAITM
ncbi:MAG: ATP-dependent Clp protease ATP-binding subunit [Hydrogenoanaerobacterium sp.]